MHHALARLRAALWGVVTSAQVPNGGRRKRLGGLAVGRQKGGRRSRFLPALLLACAGLLVFGAVAAALPMDPIERDIDEVNPIPDFRAPANGFRWSVPSRFGDRGPDGLINYHWNPATNTYDSTYVDPGQFPVNFYGCQTQSDRDNGPSGNTYTWEEVNGSSVINLRAGLPNACEFTHTGWTGQGTHTVRLTVVDSNGNLVPAGRTAPFVQTVTIKDWLIVSIGDSYTSGEGNPDVQQRVRTTRVEGMNGVLRGEVLSPARWEDERCHRSANAAPAQAALSLEMADPHTSVTFISLACSGATIAVDTYDQNDTTKPQGSGILGAYRGAVPPTGVGYTPAERLPAQLQALRNLVGNRQVDALVISGGGNDIGFFNIASLCVTNARCYTTKVTTDLIPDDQSTLTLADVVYGRLAALNGEDGTYDRLADAIHDPASPWHLNVANVVLTEYFNPTKDDQGHTCGRILQDILFWPFDMSAAESDWAINSVLTPLNQAIQNAVNQQAAKGRPWKYVGNIAAAFAGPSGGPGHGYCASDNWVRTATEAMYIQGPFPQYLSDGSAFIWGEVETRAQVKGTLHPSTAGHRIIKDRILDKLDDVLTPPATLPTPPAAISFDVSNTITNADGTTTTNLAGPQGWLVGSCTGTTCTSNRVVLTMSALDNAAIRGASLSVNDVPVTLQDGVLQCPAGLACVNSLSSDGKTYRWTITISQEGGYRFRITARGDDGQVATLSHDVRVDLTNPTVSSVLSRPPDHAGWYTWPVNITFGGQDTQSGAGIDLIEYRIDQTDATPSYVASGNPITISTNGVHTVHYQAIDLAGRRSALATLEVKVDATAPQVSCGAADGLWHASNLSIPCTASDTASGLADSVNDATFSLTTNVAADTETTNASTSSRQVCDQAGNCVTAGPINGNKVDRKAPVVTISSPVARTYALGEVVTATYTCEDGGSGVTACNGTVANNSQIDTGSVGTKTFTVSASDSMGNAMSGSVGYDVAYNICRLYDSTKSYKSGSVAPIKLQLCNATGANVSSLEIAITATGVRQTSSDAAQAVQDAGNANPDSNFRYDPTLGGYIFNLATRDLATGTYELTLTVAGDPQPHTVPFSIR